MTDREIGAALLDAAERIDQHAAGLAAAAADFAASQARFLRVAWEQGGREAAGDLGANVGPTRFAEQLAGLLVASGLADTLERSGLAGRGGGAIKGTIHRFTTSRIAGARASSAASCARRGGASYERAAPSAPPRRAERAARVEGGHRLECRSAPLPASELGDAGIAALGSSVESGHGAENPSAPLRAPQLRDAAKRQ